MDTKTKKDGRQRSWWEEENDYYAGEFGGEDDYYQSGWGGGYNYGFGQKLTSKNETKEESKSSFTSAWDEYKKTGVWRGYSYFQQPQLDYRYVEQMANAFGSKYKINVVISDTWAIDIRKKELMYNPSDLTSGTKAHLIASLLHEIGHLRHTTHYDDLQTTTSSPFVKYKNAAREVLNVFEDFRIDELMSKSYSGAEDVFEANKPIIRQMAESYKQKSLEIKGIFAPFIQSIEEKFIQIDNHIDRAKIVKNNFGSEEKYAEVKAQHAEMKKQALTDDTLFNYIRAILLRGYGEKTEFLKTFNDEGTMRRIIATETAIPASVTAKSTQEVLRILEKDVYPIIEDLMQGYETQQKELAQALGGDDLQQRIAEALQRMGMGRNGDGRTTDRKGQAQKGDMPTRAEQDSMASGHSDNDIPPELFSGDYKTLKDSVRTGINQLVAKLMFIRRAEVVPRWSAGKTRGKLDIKKLYKHRIQSRRVFKSKEETKDTISSFAFSICIDISGSMNGNRMVHTTRGLVLLGEVFQKMGIPFEVTVFNNNTRFIKKFDEEYDEIKKRNVGGLVSAANGGTNMYSIFRKLEIAKRTEKNKILLLLSDGGVGGDYDYKAEFIGLEKKGVKTLGISLACGKEIIDLCLGKGIEVNNAQMLPSEFANLLRNLIKRK